MSQNVLITGANSGFGRLTTETLVKAGHTVYGTMRDKDGRNKEAAAELQRLGAKVVEIDVTNDQSVETGVAAALQQAGNLDVLINNAGVGNMGLQEMYTVDDWQKLFNINVFGVQRMNRAVLPSMRERKAGTLIHVSSLLGRFVLPFYGPYNASKHALEAMADNYRVELSGFGIDSLIVEPGGYGTDFGTRLMKPSDTSRAAGYGPMADAPEQAFTEFAKVFEKPDAPQPQEVADAIANLIATPRGQRPFRTTVDGLGMKPHIDRINEAADAATTGIYTAFGMDGMLKVAEPELA